mmetsp:Transcript_19633/g.35401  ORF Transcript_19633/g.35401 Transcript_19633/m.35401 type:complete len:111 (-) Transcript_19633:197-529(-)|eukprot:CAMPEP_0175061924 /NCGR_PEP_ID=MMETSP0052_2-20121109/13863_1 /TAXON_ID=51329 ORGANISM="Polytomella parva, Strain SAG 63-3" /NCGR_SAMPLE_ID=MMETSP0052_2 /ASSEMBLY_ACC=CAM_ASM_000194 /LENGTH=110 /DNA_ID=CAMNT_0016327849 /DNA_START=108 /DNA_END=440 /DNA_ORIENTATION=-
MQVSSGTDGVQKLLAAEQEANAVVTEAKKAKADRLRQARAEADREITAYRAEREGAYQKKLAESSSGSQVNLQRLTSETNVAIQKINADVYAKKKQVVESLLKFVSTVTV